MMLSVLIPARNEIFLARTVEDILSNIEGDTEVIVVLDGAWADPGLPQDPRLTVVYLPEAVGQRAATNLACRIATGKYVMKCDAHCSFDKGFDVKMCTKMKPEFTMVPKMYNLHVFDWVCPEGHRRYQGPSGPCTKCGKDTVRDVLWRAKPSPETTAMRFDRDLRFQYWSAYKKRQQGHIVETMSILGACFMLTREKYWELDICDEKHGSWGQQGTEVACKTWLSGGRLVCNKNTWFAHMFRTQGKDFSHPYPISGSQVEHAREYSKHLWLGNKWHKAKRPLKWVFEHFAPVPEWNDKGIVYYTDNQLNVKIAKAVQAQLLKAKLPIVSASLKPMKFGKNVHVPGERSALQMFKQILAALKASTAGVVFFCEADVLYHPSHFDFVPPREDTWYYNTNVWKVDANTGHAFRVDSCRQVSGICVYRHLALEHYSKRIKMVEEQGFSMKMGYEPGTHGRPERVDDAVSETWESEWPNVDIRHDNNFSPTRWSKEQFRNQRYTEGWIEADEVPGWGTIKF